MKKMIFSFLLSFFAYVAFAQNSVEGKIKALNMQSITITLNEPSSVMLKGKKVTVIKKFNLSETFPTMKGEGTMDLAEGIVSQQQGKMVIIKVNLYHSTKVENGVKKPMAKIGNKAVLKY